MRVLCGYCHDEMDEKFWYWHIRICEWFRVQLLAEIPDDLEALA